MMLNGKRLCLHTGYDIITDLHHGFTFACKPWLLVAFHFNWPHLIWYNKHWAMNEPGYIQGMPVARREPKRWLLRGIAWPCKLMVRYGS